MNNETDHSAVIEATSLTSYFRESFSEILEQRDTRVSSDAEAYVVNLLVHYSRSDRFFGLSQGSRGLKPLAMLYGDAVQANNTQERAINLRRLGDVALFVAGMFGPSLTNKATGINYYISMGGGAYDWLSSDLEQQPARATHSSTFRELAERFEDIVDSLDEMAEQSTLRGNRDLLTLYEKWLRTGDPKTASQLTNKGLSLGTVSTGMTH